MQFLWTKTANKFSFPFTFFMCIRMKITTFQSSFISITVQYTEEREKKKKRGRERCREGGKKEGGKEEKGSIETLRKNI